jgi:HEAT repeat protein
MADPNLEAWEEQLLAGILQNCEIVQEFVCGLSKIIPGCAEVLSRVFNQAEQQWEMGLPIRPKSQDFFPLLRLLSMLENAEESRGLLPFLIAMLTFDAPKVQSKAALLIQAMDRELAFTRRLLRHPIPGVRANTMEALLKQNDSRALEYFRRGTTDACIRVRAIAAAGLWNAGDSYGLELLMDFVCNPDTAERRCGVSALGLCATAEHLDLLDFLEREDPDPRVRQLAVKARKRITNEEKDTDR